MKKEKKRISDENIYDTIEMSIQVLDNTCGWFLKKVFKENNKENNKENKI